LGANVLVRGAGVIGNQAILGGTNGLTNQGTITADRPGLTLNIQSDTFTNQGAVRAINGGTLNFGTPMTQTAGTLEVAAGTITSSSALQIQGGLVTGFGNINAAISNNAMLRPGLGGSGLSVSGNVSLLSASNLVFQLGGLTQGSQYGFLNVSGSVSLGGNLAVSLVNGFLASNSNNFTVLSSTAPLAGSFANVASGSRLSTTNNSGTFLVTYSGSSVVLSDYLSNSGRPAAVPAGEGLAAGDAVTSPAVAEADSPLPPRTIATGRVAAQNLDAPVVLREEGSRSVAVDRRAGGMNGRTPGATINLESSDHLLSLLDGAEPTGRGGRVTVRATRANRGLPAQTQAAADRRTETLAGTRRREMSAARESELRMPETGRGEILPARTGGPAQN